MNANYDSSEYTRRGIAHRKKLKRRRWLLRLKKLLYLTGYLGFSFLALGVVGPLEGNTLGFLEFWGMLLAGIVIFGSSVILYSHVNKEENLAVQVKKVGGRVIGAQLTVAEKKAMNMEIQKQLAEYDRKHYMEVAALVLWQMHVQLGFGKKRLEQFYNNFEGELSKLIDRYDLEDEDGLWLCTHQLKEIDVDMSKLIRVEGKTDPIMK